jgi:hypothetical protein
MLGDFSVKVGKEDTSKPKIGYESPYEISNYNGGIIVNLAISENSVVKSTMFLKTTFINTPGPPEGKTHK